ncbi:hypothetical protein C0993_005810, partial [Termitomyces sp. T159_Od127]
WAKENKFESKLPGDVKKRKADAEHVIRTLDNDLKEKKLKERAVKYTHKVFRQAAMEWLVATDQVRSILVSTWHPILMTSQPIQALEHPKFREIIDVASHATDGVKIPE